MISTNHIDLSSMISAVEWQTDHPKISNCPVFFRLKKSVFLYHYNAQKSYKLAKEFFPAKTLIYVH